MRTTTYTDARNNLKGLMNKVCADHTPTVITNNATKEEVVMLSLEDYNALEETSYLMRSPKNASRLLASKNETAKGKYKKRALR